MNVIEELITLKKLLKNLYCILGNDETGEGGGLLVETDPTVRASIKTLTDEDVAKIKALYLSVPLTGTGSTPVTGAIVGDRVFNPDTIAHFIQKGWIDTNFFNKEETTALLTAVYKAKGNVETYDDLPLLENHQGDVYNVIDTGDNYVWLDDLNNTGGPGWDKLSGIIDTSNLATNQSVDDKLSQETLDKVMLRGNYASKYITFTNSPTNRLSALGFNPTTYSMYFGGMKADHTGIYNIGFGTGSGSNITTGKQNVFIGANAGFSNTTGDNNTVLGTYSGRSITTGSANTFLGVEAGNNTSTAFKNTFVGAGSAYQNTTGSLNTIIGYKTALGSNLGDRNTIIGMGAGQGATGTNNVLIGVGAGNNSDLANKLIIHSNHTLGGYSATAEGTMSAPQFSNLSNALITGDFAEKWLRFNSSLQVTGLPDATGNGEFTKQVIAKADGTIGLIDKVSTEPAKFLPVNDMNGDEDNYISAEINQFAGVKFGSNLKDGIDNHNKHTEFTMVGRDITLESVEGATTGVGENGRKDYTAKIAINGNAPSMSVNTYDIDTTMNRASNVLLDPNTNSLKLDFIEWDGTHSWEFSSQGVKTNTLRDVSQDGSFNKMVVSNQYTGELGLKDIVNPVPVDLYPNVSNVVGLAFFELIAYNKAVAYFEILEITIGSGETVIFETADETVFKTANKVHNLPDGRKLLVQADENTAGIKVTNLGDSDTFEIRDTFLFFLNF